MKTKNKASGFFIVEVLIVLVLVALLTLLLLPNLKIYADRAKFQDVIRTAESVKPAVEMCFLQNNRTDYATNCIAGKSGIPANVLTDYGGHVKTLQIFSGGVIKAVATSGIKGADGATDINYVLNPYLPTASDAALKVVWTTSNTDTVNNYTSPSKGEKSTCASKGLC